MSIATDRPLTLALFCKVVDNYGDIGICWRLARQLQQEHGIDVTLWVDDLASFQRLWPAVRCDLVSQQLAGVTVRHWQDQLGNFAPHEVADIVIEFFAVDLPPGYVNAMAARLPRPHWFNLEGLSAEAWVEGCHKMPSTHPRLPLMKHFFFPGFNANTGGLMRETSLTERQARWCDEALAGSALLARLGVSAHEARATLVSLFCYPHAPLADIFAAWQGGAQALTCLVPEGVASEAVAAFLGAPARAGAARTAGALCVRVIDFVDQDSYDELLWRCDLNFVRGEDSFVRAQWAGKPFVWHIYPQDEALHHKKLRAFLDCYGATDPALAALSLCWNGADTCVDWATLWQGFAQAMPALRQHATRWDGAMQAHGDLAANLLAFAAALK